MARGCRRWGEKGGRGGGGTIEEQLYSSGSCSCAAASFYRDLKEEK